MPWTIFCGFLISFSQAFASSTCVTSNGTACGPSGSGCSFNSNSYGKVDPVTGYIELFNLCYSGYYGTVPSTIIGTGWTQIRMSVIAEYSNDLVFSFFDSLDNLLFRAAFGTYSGTTAEVIPISNSQIYQHCQPLPYEFELKEQPEPDGPQAVPFEVTHVLLAKA